MKGTSVEIEVRKMRIADGRTLAWAEYGDPRGRPVLYFHGGGTSLLEGACFDREARETGIRLIAPSRPGAWQSSPKPGMQALDYASDCVALTQHLGLHQFVTTGNSNGGLFTMAVAYALPERVVGAAPINATSPIKDPAVRRMAPRTLRTAMLAVDYLGWAMPAVVRSSIRSGRYAANLPAGTEPEVAEVFLRSAAQIDRDSFSMECRIATRPWGFDHRAVRCPVRILYGEDDTSRYLGDTWARELRDGQHITFPGGHLPLMPAARRILAATWQSLLND